MFDLMTAPENAKVKVRASELNGLVSYLPPQEVLRAILAEEFEGGVGVVSSFGTESAVLLHMVAEIDPTTPIVFLDTGMLFPETLAYRDELQKRLGLTDIRVFTPDPEDHARLDPEDMLWSTDVDACCGYRKVAPLAKALEGFGAWINGRKRYHGDTRANLTVVEPDGDRIKVNPLATLDGQEIQSYFIAHHLPLHPLQKLGFSSIGCMPCTSRTAPGEAARAGRWRGSAKTECGIHLSEV
ncbi:phosphoadenosine phosphosulfate reductase [Terrihabitans soli]|uniref:Adenosine 5'-phosphosulfate reductase n=1 Tax=Terrihabitans soli TaxID=708113 RepID=A0A6S6QKL7_9HYPH|nr:phosphoadenylyl-sulfate reductase [Terrihabitans soli]BCJ91853.1 phosphoadenosine phosphosulfate reductase [Terrihabitans soli]